MTTEELSKVDTILMAAQQRFGHYGLCKTTMNEIAEDIGMSKASLYYYYPDKEKLFEAVIEKEQGEFINDIQNLISESKDTKLLLNEYLKKRQQYGQKFQNLAKLKYDALMTPKACIEKLKNSFQEKETALIESILALGISKKDFREIDPKEYAEFIISIMQGLRLSAMKKINSTFSTEDYAALNIKMQMALDMVLKDIERIN